MLVITKESCEKKVMPNGVRIIDIYEKIAAKSKDEYEYLSSFKNCRKGEKCFLIGNGPSLQTEDLQKIWERKITSFGCNGIMPIFDKTDWRPGYPSFADDIVTGVYGGRTRKAMNEGMKNYRKKITMYF